MSIFKYILSVIGFSILPAIFFYSVYPLFKFLLDLKKDAEAKMYAVMIGVILVLALIVFWIGPIAVITYTFFLEIK